MSAATAGSEVKEFYSNDIVYRFDKRKRIKFGVVVDSYEASSDSDEYHALQKGQIRVQWLNSSREQVWRQNKVRLMSRSVIPGDIVRRLVYGKETQRGYCKESKQYATVQIVGTDKIIERVSSERLSTVCPLDINVTICLGNKYGRIQNFDQKIKMQSKCGSVVEILSTINHDVEDYWLMKRNQGFFESFYPGQEVVCTPNNLEQANWIVKSKVMRRNMSTRQRFTVQNVETTDIEVAWHEPTTTGCSVIDLKPEEIKNVKYLEPMDNHCLELAERRLLKLSSSDVLIRKRNWLQRQSTLYYPDSQRTPTTRHVLTGKKKHSNNSSSNINKKLFTRPSLNSLQQQQQHVQREESPLTLHQQQMNKQATDKEEDWVTEDGEDLDESQDYTTTTDIDSNVSLDDLSSATTTTTTERGGNNDSKDCCKEMEKSKYCHFPPKLNELVSGKILAVEVLCIDSKATIVWQDGTEEKDIPTTQLYYSISLDDHEFFPGEWVVKEEENNTSSSSDSSLNSKYGAVQNVNYLERTATVKWFSYSEAEKKPVYESTEETSVYDLKKHNLFAFRPGSIVKRKPTEENKLGYVVDSCPQGYVIVQWIDGSQENCYPQNLELIPESIEYELSFDENDDSAQVSWETESIESCAGDLTDETMLQNMAARLDFVRNRIIYLKEAFRLHNVTENFMYLRDLLMVYENSSYLDKLLDTSFFSLKSKHFQTLLVQVREKAKACGVELRGRLFNVENLTATAARESNSSSSNKAKISSAAEKENINKVMKLEHKINAHIENTTSGTGTATATTTSTISSKDPTSVTKDSGEPSTPMTPDCDFSSFSSSHGSGNGNLCVELLSMLKVRMDLAYAEIISRIGGSQALSVMTKALDNQATPSSTSTPLPSIPTTPEDSFKLQLPSLLKIKTKRKVSEKAEKQEDQKQEEEEDKDEEEEPYAILEEVHSSHRFINNKFEVSDLQRFQKAVQKEYKLLKESLPPNVWVRSFSNRIDLLSVMIRGPNKTPYEDGLFLFDVQLSGDYPRSPPLCHYISFSSERLNPNLYVEGKVCVSLLGTWMGKGVEVWGPNSTLLQLIVSIQGLILVAEPYYNEAGYEKQVDSQQGYENSRTYNELVILKLVQSMNEMLKNPPEPFKNQILKHFKENGNKMCTRLKQYCSSNASNTNSEDKDKEINKPEFPLLPVSKGLKLSLNTALDAFQRQLNKL